MSVVTSDSDALIQPLRAHVCAPVAASTAQLGLPSVSVSVMGAMQSILMNQALDSVVHFVRGFRLAVPFDHQSYLHQPLSRRCHLCYRHQPLSL